MDFRAQYLHELDARGFAADTAQLKAVEALTSCAQRLARAERTHWLTRIVGRKRSSGRGLYLWGGVGRGKTFLMDLFFDALPTDAKFRAHFHRFMQYVHDALIPLDGEEDPLAIVARDFAERYRVLCLDEFFVSDIADAMILARLLEVLFANNCMLITTSNAQPDDLYRDGLQRARFVPAIQLLETHCDILSVDGGIDYRLRLLTDAETYLDATDSRTRAKLALYFDQLAPGRYQDNVDLEISGRQIATRRLGKSVVWFTFSALCEGPRSQKDYIAIAKRFQSVILSDIPQLGPDDNDTARRFIAAIDEFYDRRIKLVVSAAVSIDDLYIGTRLAFEFERTRSRLIEMRSKAYMSEAHRP